jgi:hypothetical protein
VIKERDPGTINSIGVYLKFISIDAARLHGRMRPLTSYSKEVIAMGRTRQESRSMRGSWKYLAGASAALLVALAVAAPASAARSPKVRLVSHPSSTTTSRFAAFGWQTNLHVVATHCSFNGGPFRSCHSSVRYSGLKVGLHHFVVKVRGRTRTASASFWWRVVRPASVSSVTASCSGDVLSGDVSARGWPGEVVVADLLGRSGGNWAPTGAARKFRMKSRAEQFAYSFNVSGLTRSAFRVDAGSASSGVVLASSCAPPTQLPEAGFPAALPASLAFAVGVLGLVAYRRRRSGSSLV